jgi:glutathione peroxidase
VLGFPSNDFNQEPGTEAEVHEFACSRYKVSFPMFSKVKVTGSDAHPLFKYLGKEKSGLMGREAPFWNFQKFLVDKDGKVVERYAPKSEPSVMVPDIEKTLA